MNNLTGPDVSGNWRETSSAVGFGWSETIVSHCASNLYRDSVVPSEVLVENIDQQIYPTEPQAIASF